MKTPEQIRIETKLKLWETAGFSQFLEDLQKYKGFEQDIQMAAGAVRRIYIEELKEMEQIGKLEQTKIIFNDNRRQKE